MVISGDIDEIDRMFIGTTSSLYYEGTMSRPISPEELSRIRVVIKPYESINSSVYESILDASVQPKKRYKPTPLERLQQSKKDRNLK